MAEKLTPQQEMAVTNRGGKLLVSAAAGSGKTKVLVDRLLGYLTDPDDPANIDEFLIITYTKAAAAELRAKIASKISERIAREPDNRHLQRQLQRIYLTKISTVHAFCSDLLREYAYRLDIAGDFRVGDEMECTELKMRAMEQILDDAYAHADENPDFLAFVDTQGLGRSDALVPEILSKVYESARCHLDPQLWLSKCLTDADVENAEDASQTLWGSYLMEDLSSYLTMQIGAMQACVDMIADIPELAKPHELLLDIVYQLTALRECKTWDDVHDHRRIDYGRLTFPRSYNAPEITEPIKAIRNACKEGLERKLTSFTDPSEQVLKDLSQSAPSVRGMIGLVEKFSDAYDRLKRSYRILDFGDLEHRTLDLLLGKNRSAPTAIARGLGEQFREIMVDEYQDSNAVQDAIFSALTQQKQNLFMVGDVKQSIYQFRLADPGIFLEKYTSYADAANAEAGQGRKVLLSSNFRSGGGVIHAVNDVFRDCMTPSVGGLVYGPEEALREGIPHKSLSEPEVELHAIDVQVDTYAEEAAFVAAHIQKLISGNHMVRQGDGERPITAGDIVILLRSPGSVGGHFVQALELRGIRCSTGNGVDLFACEEVATLRSLLQTISNPRQDIPLVAALSSPIFAFTADELAKLRAQNRSCCMYDALQADASEKTAGFLSALQQLREEARMGNLTELWEKITLLLRFDSIYGAMPDGDLRKANLQSFFQLLIDFESRGGRGLEQFLSHLDAMEAAGITGAAEQSSADCVTIMSIHKSKGLEFPVVFVCGLSRRFNRESLQSQVLCDKEMGLGLSCIDPQNRIRYPAISKRAIAVKAAKDSLSEELRVLYVALTRARDRLIMTYASNSLESDLLDLTLRMDLASRELITGSVSCQGDWILYSALRRTEAGALFALGGKPKHTTVRQMPWSITVSQAPVWVVAYPEEAAAEEKLCEDDLLALRAALTFQYPHAAATEAPSKQTATQRKGRFKDMEAAEQASEQCKPQRNWRAPTFAQSKDHGTEYGTAVHVAMQYIRYEACTDLMSVDAEIDRLVGCGFLTAEQGSMIDRERLAAFFASPLGRKLRESQHVLREFKFSILDDGSQYARDLAGEQILLQGVVDCALIEPDGITVVDFKTDRVTQATIEDRAEYYRPQVQAYADALSRIYGLPIKERLLYFFQIDQLVDL